MMRKFLLAVAFLFLSFPATEAANRFAVCTVACTWDGASTAMWSASTGGATGASVPGSADAVIFDAATCVGGVTCTATVNTNPSISTLTMGACTASTTGCVLDFSANNNSITFNSVNGGLSVTGTGTRTLNMGNGTWTFVTNAGSAVDFTTTTSLTFNAGTSTIVFSGASLTNGVNFVGGGKTFGTFTDSITAYNGFGVGFTASASFASFNMNAGGIYTFNSGLAFVVTNAVSWAGTLAKPISLSGGVTAPTFNIANGSTISNALLGRISFTTSAGAISATSSYDRGGNNMNGGSITAPVLSSGGRCIGC